MASNSSRSVSIGDDLPSSLELLVYGGAGEAGFSGTTAVRISVVGSFSVPTLGIIPSGLMFICRNVLMEFPIEESVYRRGLFSGCGFGWAESGSLC